MKTIYTVCLIALLGAMMVVTPASAATTWDVYPGDLSDSIRNTINTASDGDTVFFHAGTYILTGGTGDWRLLLDTPNITLRGEGADVTILDGMGKPVIFIGAWEAAPDCVVEGFRIVNGSVGVAVAAESPNCIIRNNVFDGMSTAISAAYSPNTTIKGNVIDGLSKYIEFRASPVTFVDNVVSNSTKTYASVKFYIPDAVIVNNTFINNVAGMGLYTGTINATVARNNFISSGAGIKLYNAPSGNRIYLNNIVDNTDNVVISGSGTPINIWNSTEPIEYTHDGAIHTNYLGNYWSDYSGVDTSLEDGIGDTPYDIPPASPVDYDHHPLMESFENYISEEAPSAPTPPTSFLISGNITYDNGNPILNPTVTVRNIDTSEDFTVKTDAGSNYYRVLTDSSHVSAGNAILINASDGTVYNGATHIVTASEIETGGFMQDMILESGDKPDLIVTEMSGECVSLSTYNITYTVKNNGSMAADASTTSTRIDGTEVATEPVPALAIGESHTSTVGLFTLSGDNDTIEVCADSGNVINELDETNNCLSNMFEAPSIPDLIVWGIAKTPGDISEENILGVRVKNIGTTNAGSFDVSLSIDGTQVLLETVTSLAAGETTELEYTWTPPGAGEYALSATVDTNNDVEEFDETNNDYARTSVIIKPTDWAQFHYDASGIGFSPSGAPSTDTVKWISEDINAGGGLSWGGFSDMGPVVAGGKIFTYCGAEGFSSTPYDVACLDEETGELLWKVALPYSMIYGSWAPLGYDDGMVFCTVNHYVVALDADDGSIVWECDLDSPEFAGHAWSVNSGPTIADGKVFAGTYDDGGISGAGGLAGYVAIDEYTGEKLWQTTGDGHCDSTPAYYDGVVYAGFDYDWYANPSGGCYALDADTGEEIWRTWLPFSVWGSVSVDEDYVYGANYNFYGTAQVFILYRNNGTLKVISESLRTDSTPAVAYDNIYICCGCEGYSDTGTFCVDKETLEVIWSASAGSWTASPAVADGKVYVGGYCYDAFTGEEIFSYEQGGLSPVIANGCLFNVQNGRVYAFYTLPAAVRIGPETLNLKSKGKFTAFVTLPAGYDVADINVSTVECEGAPALSGRIAASDTGTLVVKFARADLVDVSVGDAVEMSVTGELADGTGFHGSDLVRVIAESDEVEKKRKSK